ncbi:hypothetical protein [Thermomonas sp.]|uniref:hypothetical protein n=1 Tax=Thermomonas sp. TaxID=1971895 RepID=UPI0024891429|nr:hypothetical protein [Thermomonas sp.]MDI1253020.1 hypothetical protein [Thermomonas sp.]
MAIMVSGAILRLAIQQQKTWGSKWFRLKIKALAERELPVRLRGRPNTKEKCTDTIFQQAQRLSVRRC